MSNANNFRSIFAWMMGFVALVWIWAVALIFSWPVEKTAKWEPEFRLVATCADKQACSIPYGKLAEARAKGTFTALLPPEPIGEEQEADAWLRWRTETAKPWQYEVKRSNWDFEMTVRYRFEGETPVLVEVLRYDVGLLLYAIPLGFITALGLFLRSLRG